jgi:50S ribosomal protein L16 3-hydroxylase
MLPEFKLPMAAGDFLARHWQKTPLFMPGAARGLEHPSAELLAALALEDVVESRIISGHGDGPWNAQNGPFSEADFNTLPARYWTLLVQSVDHYLTEVSLLLDSFDFLPGWRLEDIMISYAAEGGSVGPHFDRYDVFLLQAHGTREWHIGPTCDATTPLLDHAQLKLIDGMPVEQTFVASPGDVLYLPPGVGHWGTARDSDCVTWSVGFRAPALVDVLDRLADEAARGGADSLFTDPARTRPEDNTRLGANDQQMLVDQALTLLDSNVRRNALSALLSESRQPDGLDFAIDCGHIAASSPSATLVRHGAARLLVDDAGGVWLNGEYQALSGSALALAQRLAARRLYSDDDLGTLDAAQEALLDEWIDAGLLAWLE